MTFKISPFRIQVTDTQNVSAELYMPETPKAIFVFAHGAGAGMNHSFMVELAGALAARQIVTLRFNLMYMEQGKKRPDSPADAHKVIVNVLDEVHRLYSDLPLFAGGKSFGGRMTSQLISSTQIPFVKGLIFIGFPLHPAGKPSVERAEHLQKIKLPMLFLQGTRDTLAEWSLLERVCNALPSATIKKLEGADHAFKLPKQNAIPVLAMEISEWIDRMNR